VCANQRRTKTATAAAWGQSRDVLGAVVAHERPEAGAAGAGLARRIDGRSELGVVRLAEDDARALEEARAFHLRGRRPARAAVGAAILQRLAAQGCHRGRCGTGQGADGGHGARVAKEDRGAGRVEPGPDDPLPRRVKALLSERRPRGPERGRVRERRRDALCGEPASANREHQQGRNCQKPHPLLHAQRAEVASGPPEPRRSPKSRRTG
jgi:hypothetical protein